QARGDDDGVEPPQRALGVFERGAERLGPLEVADRDRGLRAGAPACDEVGGAALELVLVAAEERDGVSALGHEPGQRAAHAAGAAEESDLHGGSPKMRIDCAERSVSSGSYFRRMRWNSSRRGSIARKCSGRVNMSFAR